MLVVLLDVLDGREVERVGRVGQTTGIVGHVVPGKEDEIGSVTGGSETVIEKVVVRIGGMIEVVDSGTWSRVEFSVSVSV